MYLKCKYITDNQLFEYKNSKILLYLCSGSGYRTRLVIKWLLTLFLFKGGSKNYGFKFLPVLVLSVSAVFRLLRCHFVKSHQSHSPLCFAKIGCGSE